MSKTYKQPSIVSGLTINDVMNMDINTFNSLKTSDLKKVVGRLVSAGNKRLRSFERVGESSPSTRYVARSGGAFSVKGKNINELRAEYVRAKNFLQSKTGSRKGWKQVKKETADSLKKQGVNVTPEQLNKMLEAYEDLKEIDPSVSNKNMKYRVLDEISEMVDGYDVDDIIKIMRNRMTEIYEETEENNNGVSEFFPI